MKKKMGRQGLMAIKIDLEKSYDRIKWNFLEEVLRKIGFEDHFVCHIMNYTSQVSLSILWHDNKFDSFQPSRGIRKGDPLSPFLFILCIEVLSHDINEAMKASVWKDARLSRHGHVLSHLCFADDLLLFRIATEK